jgi:hypothetical protein
MRIKETNLYQFNELSEAAKAHAIDWWISSGIDGDWHECTLQDTIDALELIGFSDINILFSGFSSQGDGACFTGSYEYQKGAVKSVKKEFPKWEALHRLAEQMQLVSSRYFYRLCFMLEHNGRYQHENSVTVNYVERSDGYGINNEYDLFDELQGIVREFMQEIYFMLEKEYRHCTSKEQASENIVINEYEFNENGGVIH